MKKFYTSIITYLFSAFFCVVADAIETAASYNPVEALRNEKHSKRERIGLPEKNRDDAIALSVAGEYFLDFGSDLPNANGYGLSISGTAHFDSDTPEWDFIGELEFLGFTAESGHYTYKGSNVTETLHSANVLTSIGLSFEQGRRFVFEALAGLGAGVTYGEIRGENFKTSSSGNWTTTLCLKARAEYRITEKFGIFTAYRFAYISPSIASKIVDWHNLDLFTHSVELGLRYRF